MGTLLGGNISSVLDSKQAHPAGTFSAAAAVMATTARPLNKNGVVRPGLLNVPCNVRRGFRNGKQPNLFLALHEDSYIR